MLEIVKAAGYKGLVIVIDEAETILRMRSDSRHKSLNGIRQIADASGAYPGLLWVFTGTPEFFDTRHGVAGLAPAPRADPVPQAGTVRQPAPGPARADALRRRAAPVRRAPAARALSRTATGRLDSRVSTAFVERLVAEVTTGFKGDVGVVPRQFLREFVTQLDLVDEHDGLRPDDRVRFPACRPEPRGGAGAHGYRARSRRRGYRRLVPRRTSGERLRPLRTAGCSRRSSPGSAGRASGPCRRRRARRCSTARTRSSWPRPPAGKTEASIFPVLSGLRRTTRPTAVGALYVAPIKALLNNQADRLGLYTEMVGLRRFVWHGDTPDHARRRFLREPAELLMTTPESLEVMLVSPGSTRPSSSPTCAYRHRRGPRARGHRPRRPPDERDSSGWRALPP